MQDNCSSTQLQDSILNKIASNTHPKNQILPREYAIDIQVYTMRKNYSSFQLGEDGSPKKVKYNALICDRHKSK